VAFSSLSPIFAFSSFRPFVILFLLRLASAWYLHEKDSFAFQGEEKGTFYFLQKVECPLFFSCSIFNIRFDHREGTVTYL